MNFSPQNTGLPVSEIVPYVIQHLDEQNTLIVSAPPGAGKSTVLPLALLDAKWLNGRKILMLEPRRLAARAIALRMSDLIGDVPGDTIGYRIRFESKTSENTRIEVVTEGILTRMLHGDNSLENVGLVIFDEFHERSIHADVALALCRDAQQILRQDLRIMIMSATLDMPRLTEILQAPVAASQGKLFPVDVIYTGEQDLMFLPELTARTIIRATNETAGDILVFLPGEGEIRKCEEILKKELHGIAIHPLYGQLPIDQQYAAIMPHRKGKRKIVLSTSIAETSLTIEGITVVVDSGYSRISRFDPKSGLTRLETVQVSKDSADQRAGRAGRLSAGICYRMWSRVTHERLADHRIPEILEADLANLVLDLAQWGTDAERLTWLNPPPKGALAQASDILHQLNALENGKITSHGKKINSLPCHPRLAHMLLNAQETGKLALATDLAAVIEERDPLIKEAGTDINVRIEALRKYREEKRNSRRFARIEQAAESYRRIFGAKAENSSFDPYDTGVLLAYAYPERIAFARPGNNAQFQLSNGKYAFMSHKDDLASEPWLAIAHLDARDGMGKIFLASPLNPKDLAPMVREQEVIAWDTHKGGLIATRDLRIGSIVLQSRPLLNPDENRLMEAVSNAIKAEGHMLLSFDEEAVQWQNRILSLRIWRPEEDWPEVDDNALFMDNERWLGVYLKNVRKPEDLKKIDVAQALQLSMDFAIQELLDRLAPQKIKVPSGSMIKLKYQPDGSPPVLAVRLQEVFGLAETPRVNEGRTPVILHLLSPGYKPIQATMDLRSFWDNTYFEVRKELKRRYPKHSWPDDPWKEKAIRGVKRM